MFGGVARRIRHVMTVRRRRRWSEGLRCSLGSAGEGLKVNHPCNISFARNVHVGNNVNFNGMTIYGRGGVHIGDNFHSGAGCKIITANHNYEGEAIPYDHTIVLGPVSIQDNVWFGDDVLVLPDVTIAEGAIIGAGSVVTKDVERCAIVGGNPAKFIRYRDVEHYDRLKAEGRFL